MRDRRAVEPLKAVSLCNRGCGRHVWRMAMRAILCWAVALLLLAAAAARGRSLAADGGVKRQRGQGTGRAVCRAGGDQGRRASARGRGAAVDVLARPAAIRPRLRCSRRRKRRSSNSTTATRWKRSTNWSSISRILPKAGTGWPMRCFSPTATTRRSRRSTKPSRSSRCITPRSPARASSSSTGQGRGRQQAALKRALAIDPWLKERNLIGKPVGRSGLRRRRRRA